MMLFELKQQRKAALDKSEAIITAAEKENRRFTAAEESDLEINKIATEALGTRIEAIEKTNTMSKMFPGGMVLTPSGNTWEGRRFSKGPSVTLSDSYADDFYNYIATGGKQMGAALYEGSNPAGGFAVPVVVDSQIVPLAPQEMGVRQLAQVIPTSTDLKIPRKASFGTAAAKAESTTSTPTSFGGTEPTLDQFTLSAFMAGIHETISWELAQDVPAFQAFCVSDMLLAQQMFEENWFINGTGSGQPQGLLGNVAGGVTEEPDANGNAVSIDGTLDLVGSLNAVYHPNASFLMSRATSIVIRKAQRQANLFEPVFTRSNGQDYLLNYPVQYSAYMPTAARSSTPVLFGDFKQGYVIGDRGGAGINVKVLDQPLAMQGQIILLAYRRTDGRVRRSEAIQSYNVAAS